LGGEADGDLSGVKDSNRNGVSSAANEIEAALKELRDAREPAGQQRAAIALENAMKKLRHQLKDTGSDIPR
jgi:hypothetical protein